MSEFIPYGRQSISDTDMDAVRAVLESDWLTTGPQVTAFEDELAAWTGGASAVSVTSGTAALHTAYAAAGIGSGDEVITSPLTFVATAATAMQRGARVRFADVSADTGNLDPEAVDAELSSASKVIAAVDYAGHPAPMDELEPLARKASALLLEDAAHSVGGSWRGKPVGSLADLTTFSFFPTKNLTTAEGGAVVTADADLLDRARRFRNHGLVREPERQRYPDEGPWHQEVHEFGLNYRLPDVLCALGRAQLGRLAEFKRRRTEIHARYTAALSEVDELRTPAWREGADPVWHLYPLRVPAERRRAIFESLRAQGIGVQVNYIPAYWHPVFDELGYRRGMCPNAERYYSEEISLPLFPGLSDAQVDRVIEAVRAEFSGCV